MENDRGSGIYKILMGAMGILALTFLMAIISKQERSTGEARADIAKLQENKVDRMEYYNDRKDMMDYLQKISDTEEEIKNELIAHEMNTKRQLRKQERQIWRQQECIRLPDIVKPQMRPIPEPKQPWEK